MRFERESWRKLYVAESVEHKLLTVFARGLRDYLLRLAEEDGTLLHRTMAPSADLGRVLNVASGERRLFVEAIDSLLAIGYLSWNSGGRLWITKFEDAQRARSKGAIRQAKYVAKRRSDVTVPSPGDVSNDVTMPVTLTSHIDETRRDENRDPPTPKPIDRFSQSLVGNLPHQREDVLRVFEAFKQTFGLTSAKLNSGNVRATIIAEAIRDYGEPACSLVLKYAPQDGMVSGKSDEKGLPHKTIDYILGNRNAFERIHAEAMKREGDTAKKRSAIEIVKAAQGL